jgi:hypothetical protein
MSSYGVFKKKAREQVNITLITTHPCTLAALLANKITNNMTRHMVFSSVVVNNPFFPHREITNNMTRHMIFSSVVVNNPFFPHRDG